jgi:hypothetical protein
MQIERQLERRLPRVQFEEPRDESLQPTRMIVASPREQVVVSPPIIREPKYIAQEDSIAARLKARKANAHTKPRPPTLQQLPMSP